MRQCRSVLPGFRCRGLEDLQHVSVGDWSVLFRMIAGKAAGEKRRLIIVMDEFQYLGKAKAAAYSFMLLHISSPSCVRCAMTMPL